MLQCMHTAQLGSDCAPRHVDTSMSCCVRRVAGQFACGSFCLTTLCRCTRACWTMQGMEPPQRILSKRCCARVSIPDTYIACDKLDAAGPRAICTRNIACTGCWNYCCNHIARVQLLGNHGPLSEREPGQVFETAARDCKVPTSIEHNA